MSIGKQTLCYACKRFQPLGIDGPTCTAFPDGIPTPIIQGGFDHRNPYPGDGGARFVQDEEKPLPAGYEEKAQPREPVIIADPGSIRFQSKRQLRETAKRIIDEFRNHPGRPN